MTTDLSPLRVRDLRRRWKPTKERLQDAGENEALRIRLHRAFSWLERVEMLGDGAEPDDLLLYRWIALESLCATWDATARRPRGEREDLRDFMTRVQIVDHDGRVPGALHAHWDLVREIVADPYLLRLFWTDSPELGAREAFEMGKRAELWAEQDRVGRILDELLDRLFFLRSQIVHGAATYGGNRNRASVERCAAILGHLLHEIVLVIVDHGAAHEWGRLPYPPS